ncbi:MAG: STAS domain-containing protein [Actinobacteria bacterium]|nr:STAS domain-containing protein [Actinomycetota bacterium]
MSLLADVTEERRDDVVVAAVEGEIDASNAREIGERLRRLLSNHDTLLVVDLAATSYLDSAGVNLLFELSNELAARQQRLRLVVPAGSPLLRIFTIAGLVEVVPTHATRDGALAQTA